MKRITGFILIAFVMASSLSFFSCHKTKDSDTSLQSTPLYDTLGWFIQGGSGMVKGQGIVMIDDPANSGQKLQAGRLAIRTVVDSAIFVIAGDPQLQPYFPTLLSEVGAGNLTGFTELSKNLTDFIQQAVSGQKIYMGKSMKEVHNHATYSRFGSEANPTSDEGDFNQFITDVATAASRLHVPGSIISQLGTLLASVKGDVVQKP